MTGPREAKNEHRGVGNLFDVKLQAIENMAKSASRSRSSPPSSTASTTISIGAIVDFAVRNFDKVQTIAFQPVSFTGRDEEVGRRDPLRPALHAVADGGGPQSAARRRAGSRMRDWFPLSSYSAFTSVMDILQGPEAPWGWSACNCHPNCGIFSLLVVNRRTHEWTPLFKFFNYERFIRDVAVITDTARGQTADGGAARSGDPAQLRGRQGAQGFPDFADREPVQADVGHAPTATATTA